MDNTFGWAIAAFVALHVGVSATGLRGLIVARIGERPYRGLFSLASAALLIWVIRSFAGLRADPAEPLNGLYWWPPLALRPGAYALIGTGFLIGVTGILTPGPTFVGFERSLAEPEPARGILRVSRNPFLWGVALWGAGHMLVNGALYAPPLFGGLALMSLFGARSIDRKGRARDPEHWAAFEAVTSNIPFAAILQGRNKLALGEMWWRLLIAASVFVAVGLLHQRLFGAPVFATQL